MGRLGISISMGAIAALNFKLARKSAYWHQAPCPVVCQCTNAYGRSIALTDLHQRNRLAPTASATDETALIISSCHRLKPLKTFSR